MHAREGVENSPPLINLLRPRTTTALQLTLSYLPDADPRLNHVRKGRTETPHRGARV